MRRFCQHGFCCDRAYSGRGIANDNDEFIGVVWCCQYHARDKQSAVAVTRFGSFERLALPFPRTGPLSPEQCDAVLSTLFEK